MRGRASTEKAITTDKALRFIVAVTALGDSDRFAITGPVSGLKVSFEGGFFTVAGAAEALSLTANKLHLAVTHHTSRLPCSRPSRRRRDEQAPNAGRGFYNALSIRVNFDIDKVLQSQCKSSYFQSDQKGQVP